MQRLGAFFFLFKFLNYIIFFFIFFYLFIFLGGGGVGGCSEILSHKAITVHKEGGYIDTV